MKKIKNPIVHFEIPVDDVERARDFYTETFGWEIDSMEMPESSSTNGDPYYSVRTSAVDENKMAVEAGAINGGMMRRMHPKQPFMNYISVESIDEMLETIIKNGGKVHMKKTEIAPNMGWIATFEDTEGNPMGLHQPPKKTKK